MREPGTLNKAIPRTSLAHASGHHGFGTTFRDSAKGAGTNSAKHLKHRFGYWFLTSFLLFFFLSL
jgi:hypothetical protein